MARGTPGLCHHPRVPQMSQAIPEKPVFPALPRLSRRGSTNTTVARGTALWESLVGKPRGKATDPLIHATGSVTLLPPPWRKAHVHDPILDEDLLPWGDSRSPQYPCQHWRGILRFRPRLHTKSEAPALKGEESREAREQFACGLSFPEATRAGPCGPRRKLRAPAATRENPGDFALQARSGPFPLRRLETNHT